MDIKSEKLFLIEKLIKTTDTATLRKVHELLTQQPVKEVEVSELSEQESKISSEDIKKKLEASEFTVKKKVTGKQTRDMSREDLDREIENW